MSDDSELLRKIEHRDESAFAELVERHGRYLHGVAHALVGNSADAEDLVQETFLAAFKSRFRGESSVRTWLVKILVRQASMLRRWRGRRGTKLFGAEQEQASEIPTPPETSGTEAKLDLTTMLQSLSEDHRAVIVLRELEGLSYEEMAEGLNVPRGTIESRLHRAREELRKRFKGYL